MRGREREHGFKHAAAWKPPAHKECVQLIIANWLAGETGWAMRQTKTQTRRKGKHMST